LQTLRELPADIPYNRAFVIDFTRQSAKLSNSVFWLKVQDLAFTVKP